MSRGSAAPTARAAAPLFAALGDETRLRILARLASAGPGSTAHLGERVDVTRQAVTKHLEVLAEAGLVRDRRAGRERLWELVPARLADAHAYLDDVAAQWDDALARLRDFVER
ncbi:MAG: winged helix-turn-helix transcriptional regulator [Myxococcales bacterium]|nr:winged helix-turn-helix transcriptional regulator [Myxococcales bacterium]